MLKSEEKISNLAKDFIAELLAFDPSLRLGAKKQADKIRNHQFFPADIVELASKLVTNKAETLQK